MRYGKQNLWSRVEDYIESKIQEKIGPVSKNHKTAGTAEEWVSYMAKKKTTGFLYRISQIIDWINSFCYRWSLTLWYDPKWWVINRFFKTRWRVTARTLKKGQYYDIDTTILHINMEMLCDFIENEKNGYPWELTELNKKLKNEPSALDCDKETGISGMPEHQWKSMVVAWEIYEWWKNYEKRQEEIDSVYDEIPERKNDSDCVMGMFSKENREIAKPYYAKIHELEDKLDKEEQEMLIKLIEIRKFLWT
jgi:Skp family chaperone for outer membrane proteins